MNLRLYDIYESPQTRTNDNELPIQYEICYISCMVGAQCSDAIDDYWCVYMGVALDANYRERVIKVLGPEPKHTLGGGYRLIPGGKIVKPDIARIDGGTRGEMYASQEGIRYEE